MSHHFTSLQSYFYWIWSDLNLRFENAGIVRRCLLDQEILQDTSILERISNALTVKEDIVIYQIYRNT